MITHAEIKNIETAYGSPFYLINRGAFTDNYDDIVKAFKLRYDKFILAYSYKTNYIPYLCSITREKGGYAEVVARLEYDLALKIGQDPRKIIFNGPVKHYEDIKFALDNQSIVNLDSWPEVEHVNKYAEAYQDKRVKVGVRVNINLSDNKGTSRIQNNLQVGRFGFSSEKDDMVELVRALSANSNVVVNSLHGHTSTTDRGVWCYKTITETLCNVAAKYWPDTVEYINIGGGIYGHIPQKFQWVEVPTFGDYAEAVCKVLNDSAWAGKHKPYLVLEPGIAMAATALSYVTKVISVKRIRGRVFVTVDGSAFHAKPTLHKHNLPYELIKQADTRDTETYNVVGSTCVEKDYLLTEITDKRLEAGDYIKIDNAGAYTVVLAPPLINVAPAVVVKQGQGYKLARRRQIPEDMFSDYIFEENI
jgi:diaminopimelate decarboxylase